MANYKAGDKVLFKKTKDIYDNVKSIWTLEKKENYDKLFSGKTLEIKKVYEESGENFLLRIIFKDDTPEQKFVTYCFEVDDEKYYFSENFIEKKVESAKKVELHDFAWALQALKEGKKVARENWDSLYLYINYFLGKDNKGGKIFVSTPCYTKVWFSKDANDLLAEDWYEVK